MKRTAQQIADFVNGELQGNGEQMLETVASLTNAGPHALTYAEEKYRSEVASSRAGCVIVGSGGFGDRTVIIVRSPKIAFARAANLLIADADDERRIDSRAVIADGVRIGPNVGIGPGAVIETGVAIGEGTIIYAGAYIGRNSSVGEHSTIHPRVVIYTNVEIGKRVIIHAGAVIGADGFGFVRDGGEYVKFPQVGRVVIEDDVEIGANTCIDRGSLETTVIRRGVKLDNLVQVAHNVDIGDHTVIAAQTGISGSCTVGARSVLGGQVGIGEHATIDAGAIVGGQAGILNGKHVKGGEVLWGTPVRPLKEFLHQQAHLSRLPKLSEEVRNLRRELNDLKKSVALDIRYRNENE
jgi:UDP-3-O-[3-hydroxymyristoyl] glucosamine N-acyltransferase